MITGGKDQLLNTWGYENSLTAGVVVRLLFLEFYRDVAVMLSTLFGCKKEE